MSYIANLNPVLTLHVINNIKVCFLKVRRADANLHAYVADALELFRTQIHCRACCLILFPCHISSPIEPEHEINLGGAPYELVPGYFINSLLVLMTYVIREGSGGHVRLRNLAKVSLLTIIKFEADEDSDPKKNSRHLRTLCFKYLNTIFIRVWWFS